MRKLLLLAVFMLSLPFFSLLSTHTTYAAPCQGNQVPGVAGTPQPDPGSCYAPGATTPSGPIQGATPPAPTNNNGAPIQGQGQNNNQTTCAIEKMGWILCPVIETAGKLGDSAFEQLAKHFLETEPELVASVTNGASKPGTYIAWEMARNIANIMFIIAFLIIIFSQVTGRGLDNYGIKKLLPKLIVAAIAVNISYYICQAMVDLTNVMGYEIENFLVDVAHQVSNQAAMPAAVTHGSATQTSDLIGHGTLATIAIASLAIAGTVFILLPLLGTGIAAIVIVCLVIIVILLMRKAFIVLLVVASPIAFVFYLLPNTERLFQKWLKMFWQLLMVFPVVGILFGGGQLASAIILIAGTQIGTGSDTQNLQANADPSAKSNCQGKDGNSVYSVCVDKCIQLPSSDPKAPVEQSQAKVGTCGARSTPLMLGLVAAGVAVAPLFAVWSVLKGALSAAGAIGGKMSGAVVGLGDKAKTPANDWEKGRRESLATLGYKNRFTRPITGRLTGHRRELKKQSRESGLKAAEKAYDISASGEGLSSKIKRGERAQAAATEKSNKQFADYVRDHEGFIPGALGNAAGIAKSELEAQAHDMKQGAIQQVINATATTDLKAVGAQMADAIKKGDEIVARAMERILLSNGGKGHEEWRGAMRSSQGSAGYAHMEDYLRQEALGVSGLKDANRAAGTWAEKGGNLESLISDAKTWDGLSAAKLAGSNEAGKAWAIPNMSQQKKQSIAIELRGDPTSLGRLTTEHRQDLGI